MNIAITGANGFIGRYLCQHYYSSTDREVLAITRPGRHIPVKTRTAALDYHTLSTWSDTLGGTDVLIHLAGIAHTTNTEPSDYYRINVDQTLEIARAAARSGVKQFIFFSSIKVNGEYTDKKPFSCNDQPNPKGHYATSKWRAEQGLAELSAGSDMAITIIRPPLVYGETPKGNLRLIELALHRGIPLPLKGIANKRDLVSLDNLANMLDHCLLNPACYGKTLLVSDGRPVSTTDIVLQLAAAGGDTPRLFACPRPLLSLIRHTPRLAAIYRKLFGNLEVDIRETVTVTGWQPSPAPEKTITAQLA